MDYDVLILGGGIIGCAVAYELSKYNLNIALIEKDFDIADDISFANTAVVYDGCECRDNLMGALEEMGNAMLDDITKKLNVPFKRVGSLTIATDEESSRIVDNRYERAKERAVMGVELVDKKRVKEIEPDLRCNCNKALYSKNTAIIKPYDLAIAYGEVAYDNGVIFRLEEVVTDIQRLVKGFKVTTNKNKFTCKFVVNTIPGDNYSIDQNKEETNEINRLNLKTYYVLIDNDQVSENIIFKIKDSDNFIIQTETVAGENLIAINSSKEMSVREAIEKTKELVPGLTNEKIKDVFYDNHHKDTMIIDDSEISRGYIKVSGKHYAEVTISPAIANLISESVVDNLKCGINKNFIDKRRDFYKFKELSNDERNELIRLDKRYGKIICLCNQVTEGEIVDCIRRPLGARTVEGVKRRTSATFGNCHGAYCISNIIEILARELDKKPTEIVEDSKNSNVLASRIKEFNEV